MHGYKCDKCGATVRVDPNEERICDNCLAKSRSREQPVKMAYSKSPKKEACYAR